MKKEYAEPNLVKVDLSETFDRFEREGKFNDNINPIDWKNSKPVKKSHPYRPWLFRKMIYGLANLFWINKLRRQQMVDLYHVKAEGTENLSGIDSAIIVANHYTIFDCLIYQKVLNHKNRIIGSEANNRKGFIGFLMRAGGMIPMNLGQMPLEISGLSEHQRRRRSLDVMKRFNSAISWYLNHKHYVVVYPEQSMWLMYEKPRPFMSGAFHWAVANNVPVIPVFSTMNPPRNEKTDITVHVGKAIYPDEKLDRQQNRDMLRDAAFEFCKETYEKVYGKKLEYAANPHEQENKEKPKDNNTPNPKTQKNKKRQKDRGNRKTQDKKK